MLPTQWPAILMLVVLYDACILHLYLWCLPAQTPAQTVNTQVATLTNAMMPAYHIAACSETEIYLMIAL